jgi:hypothetical protein
MSDAQLPIQTPSTPPPIPSDAPSWVKLMNDPYFGQWIPKWTENAMINSPAIRKEFEIENRCLSQHPRPMNRPCIILGRGPSLDATAEVLKKWQHPIFSPTSTNFWCVHHGIEPKYVLAFDAFFGIPYQLKNINSKWKESYLITHPQIDPLIFKYWKGKKFYYRRVFPGIEYFEMALPLMFPMIGIGIRFTGSVVNNAISIANFLGYRPIFLVGCDLSWRDDNQTTSTNYIMCDDGKVKYNDTSPIPKEKADKVVIWEKDGKKTTADLMSFKEGLYQIWASDNNQMIDCSDGILEEMPHVSIEEVIKKQGRGFEHLHLEQKKIIEIVMNYSRWLQVYLEQKKKEGFEIGR